LTVDRINSFIPLENIYMVTNKSHVQNINNQLPEIDNSNILIEPLIKETALFRIWVQENIDRYLIL
ncbi:MAG: hypothetical protein K0S47_4640, partial [Herbinix sp.]|nr:hypothetical protein [Herbinix sp.]